jgi:hypothetical protein
VQVRRPLPALPCRRPLQSQSAADTDQHANRRNEVVVFLVLIEELARFGDIAAGNLFAVELSNVIAVATDTEFISALISGATSFGSSGTLANAVWNDIRDLLAAVTTGANSRLYLLMPSAIAKTISARNTTSGEQAFPTVTWNGGSISGIPIVVSDGVPSQTMVMVDATQIAAASESLRLDSSREALLNLDTAQTHLSAALR